MLFSEKIINKLLRKNITISVAESCTGGLLSNILTSISGSSKVFKFGLVVYSNKSKINILHISKKIIKKYGAVSEQVCFLMIKNMFKISNTKIIISITGIAGPGGGTKKKSIGLVYIGIKKSNNIKIEKYFFKNKKRSDIQKSAVNKCLKLILSTLK